MIERIENVAPMEVFRQIGAKSTSGINVTLSDAIKEIQSDVLLQKTLKLRQLKKENKIIEAKLLKQSLPAVTFAASYRESRLTGNEDSYNALCVIDIDDLSPDDFNTQRKRLQDDPFLLAVWTSPSGNGIKGLISIDYISMPPRTKVSLYHRVAFRCIEEYLHEQYQIELDGSGKDVTRLCFLSCDQTICIKDTFERFPVDGELFAVEELALLKSKKVIDDTSSIQEHQPLKNWMNPTNRNKSADRLKMQSIIKYLRKRNLSITFQYDQWYHAAFAIANTFTFDLGLKYFTELSKLDSAKYKPQACRRMIEYAYTHSKGQISFGTIMHYAQNLGYEK